MIADSQEYTDDEVIGEIVEVTSLREENAKHFRLADGTYEAVVYTHPVHRKDENGVWQDIDNNLSLADDGGSQKYRTPDSRLKFTESFKANEELFTLSENGYSISMMLVSNNTSSNLSLTTENLQLGTESNSTVNNAPKRTVGKSFDSIDDAATINNRSSIVYNGVRVNTAIEYVLQGNDLKENIIVLHDDGTLKVTSKIYNGSQSSSYSLTHTFTLTLVVDEGIYFFKNKEVGKYMQIDDNDGSAYNTSGAIMELWDFDGGDYQKWQLIHIGDGYYKILSVESGMALCVQSGSTDENEVALVQETYSNLSRKKWKITKSSSGAYILRPKSSEGYDTDWCMCAGDQFLWVTDGLNVEQKAYVNNSSYKDEWILELLDSYKITFYGISNSGHDHSSCLETVKGNLYDDAFNNVTLKTGAISSNDCLSDLKNTNVFTSRSHGHLIVWAGTTTAASTGIILNDEEGTGMVALYSHFWSNMTSGSTSVAATDSFTGLNMVLFIGCETAYDGVTGRNLPAIVSSQGAEVAIGFSENINCSDANKWTKDFYTYLLEGHTVQESVDYASGNRSAASGLKSAVVCGNGNYKISE